MSKLNNFEIASFIGTISKKEQKKLVINGKEFFNNQTIKLFENYKQFIIKDKKDFKYQFDMDALMILIKEIVEIEIPHNYTLTIGSSKIFNINNESGRINIEKYNNKLIVNKSIKIKLNNFKKEGRYETISKEIRNKILHTEYKKTIN